VIILLPSSKELFPSPQSVLRSLTFSPQRGTCLFSFFSPQRGLLFSPRHRRLHKDPGRFIVLLGRFSPPPCNIPFPRRERKDLLQDPGFSKPPPRRSPSECPRFLFKFFFFGEAKEGPLVIREPHGEGHLPPPPSHRVSPLKDKRYSSPSGLRESRWDSVRSGFFFLVCIKCSSFVKERFSSFSRIVFFRAASYRQHRSPQPRKFSFC